MRHCRRYARVTPPDGSLPPLSDLVLLGKLPQQILQAVRQILAFDCAEQFSQAVADQISLTCDGASFAPLCGPITRASIR